MTTTETRNATRTHTATLPNGKTETRKSKTMHYTHALATLRVDGSWAVASWHTRADLAQKASAAHQARCSKWAHLDEYTNDPRRVTERRVLPVTSTEHVPQAKAWTWQVVSIDAKATPVVPGETRLVLGRERKGVLARTTTYPSTPLGDDGKPLPGRCYLVTAEVASGVDAPCEPYRITYKPLRMAFVAETPDEAGEIINALRNRRVGIDGGRYPYVNFGHTNPTDPAYQNLQAGPMAKGEGIVLVAEREDGRFAQAGGYAIQQRLTLTTGRKVTLYVPRAEGNDNHLQVAVKDAPRS